MTRWFTDGSFPPNAACCARVRDRAAGPRRCETGGARRAGMPGPAGSICRRNGTATSGGADLPSRSAFFSSFGGPRTVLVEAAVSLSPAGVALRGRPRAFFGAVTCSSATGVTFRGRPGSRRTGAASAASGSVPAASAPTETAASPPGPGAGSWQRGAARARRRRARPRGGRRCSGRAPGAARPAVKASRHSEASRWA